MDMHTKKLGSGDHVYPDGVAPTTQSHLSPVGGVKLKPAQEEVSVGQRPQAVNTLKEEAAVASFCAL